MKMYLEASETCLSLRSQKEKLGSKNALSDVVIRSAGEGGSS